MQSTIKIYRLLYQHGALISLLTRVLGFSVYRGRGTKKKRDPATLDHLVIVILKRVWKVLGEFRPVERA